MFSRPPCKIDSMRRGVRSQREREGIIYPIPMFTEGLKKGVSEKNALHGCYLDPTKVSPELVRTKQEDWLHLPSEEAHAQPIN